MKDAIMIEVVAPQAQGCNFDSSPISIYANVMTRPLILVTNDDGINSPGLHAAIDVLADLGDLLIIAPSQQQTGMARSMPPNFDGRIHPVTLQHKGNSYQAYHMNGSPAQCVLYAVIDCAVRKPDLVVSGINYGENLGDSTLVSGTVGAALQGGAMGIPSLAVSLETKKEYHYNHGSDVDWSAASHYLHYFAEITLAHPSWPDDVAVLKIDVPAAATAKTPWRLTRQSRSAYYISLPTRRKTPDEPLVMDYDMRMDVDNVEPDSDIYAFVVERLISVTPLSVDLTSRISFSEFDRSLRQVKTSAGR